MVKYLEIEFDQSYTITKILYKDADGNSVSYLFSNIVKNPLFPDTLFMLDLPSDVVIIEN